MTIQTTLGFSVEVDSNGFFELPPRSFTAAELKRIAREVNRKIRREASEDDVREVLYECE